MVPDWKSELAHLEGWTFGDDPEMADDLARKTAQGQNLANCFLWNSGSKIPKIGDRSYIMDSQRNPVCIVEVRDVCKLKFSEVGSEFAEAEGYASLEDWRQIHREFFGRRTSGFGDESFVVCQTFKLIHVF